MICLFISNLECRLFFQKDKSQVSNLVAGLKLEQQAETDTNSSTDDEDEYQSKQGNADQNMQLKSDEVSVHHKVPGYTSERLSKSILIEPTMVLRRSSTGRNRGKQSLSPEKPGVLAVKEKELKTPGDTKGVESTVSAKSKGGVVHGSSNLVVESSRDSRRLMQGARQVGTISLIPQLLQELITQ